MQTCPSCDAPGIFEHAVIVPVATAGTTLSCYSRCRACAATFSRSGDGALGPRVELPDSVVWIRAPWLPASVEVELEVSWDLAQYQLDALARELPWLAFVVPLVDELRRRGSGSRLRAGLSVASVLFSRSRDHGLRDDQSYARLTPMQDELVEIELELPHEVRREQVAASAIDRVHALLEELAAVPLE